MNTKARAAPLMIGELSDRTGVNIETIRYYERVGLFPAPPRTRGKHRAYDEWHVRRLAFIRRSRDLGFSLDDIRALLQLAEGDDDACTTTKSIALRHLADIHSKIMSLKRLERALRDMTDACAPGAQHSCPIIDALSVTR
jgi:MerR family transcriptional regulator, mercuric resistance operon regulatory protein